MPYYYVAQLRRQEKEKKRRLEDAIMHRKRSSRIALKKSEKEQALAVAKMREAEEEKMSRARRLQARQKVEDGPKESPREQRWRERETKEASRQAR